MKIIQSWNINNTFVRFNDKLVKVSFWFFFFCFKNIESMWSYFIVSPIKKTVTYHFETKTFFKYKFHFWSFHIFFDLLSILIQHMSWWGFRNTVVIYKYTLLQIKKEKNLKWLIISNTYLFNCLTIINNIFFRFFLLNLALCEQSQPNWHFVLWQHV